MEPILIDPEMVETLRGEAKRPAEETTQPGDARLTEAYLRGYQNGRQDMAQEVLIVARPDVAPKKDDDDDTVD